MTVLDTYAPTTALDRAALLRRIKGQEVRVPDIQGSCLQDWSVGVNANREKLRPIIDEYLKQLVPDDPKMLKRLLNVDFTLFTCSLWNWAGVEQLTIGAILSIWIFTWDDELDESTGSLVDDVENANKYRRDTTEFVENALGLKQHNMDRPLHRFIKSIKPVCDALRRYCTRPQLEAFMEQMRFFIDGNSEEQHIRLSGGFPSIPTYWRMRKGTIGAGLVTGVIEYMQNTHIPRYIMDTPDMRVIWDETAVVCFVTNDILSLRKELAKDGCDSLIPIRCAGEKGMSPQRAVEAAVNDIRDSITLLDGAASRLRRTFANDPAYDTMMRFIDGCEQISTGNLYWSTVTGRYGLGNAPRGKNNEMIFNL